MELVRSPVLGYTIGDIALSNPVMNAACSVAKTFEDLDALLATNASAVVIGSITPEERTGNLEPHLFLEGDLHFALNNLGMPNKGKKWYEKNLPEMIERAHNAGKPLILSIAAFDIEGYEDLALMAEAAGVDLIELNLGCPNISERTGSTIFSFDLDAIKLILKSIDQSLLRTPYSVKLSPYSNPVELANTAHLIAKSKAVAVVASNTFPNGFWQDEKGKAVIGSNAGLAGMSGPAMLSISLGQVRQFRELLPTTIDVIGVGGISKPEHVQQHLKAGASAIQAATHIVRHGHSAIRELFVRN